MPIFYNRIQTNYAISCNTELTSMKSLFRKLHQIAQTMGINEKQFTYLILRKRINSRKKTSGKLSINAQKKHDEHSL